MSIFPGGYDRNVAEIKAQLKRDVKLKDYGMLGRSALAAKEVWWQGKYEAVLKTAKQDLERCQSVLRQGQEHLDNHQEKSNHLIASVTALKEVPKKRQNENQQLRETLVSEKATIHYLDAKVGTQQAKLKQQDGIISQQCQEISFLRGDGKRYCKEIHSLNDALQKARAKICKLGTDLEISKRQRDDYRKRLHRSGKLDDTVVARYTAEITRLQAALSDLNRCARGHRERADQAEHAWDTIRDANERLRESSKMERSASSHLSDMVDNLTMKLRDSENARHHWCEAAQRT